MYIMLDYIDFESYLLFGNNDYLFRSIKQIVLATVATNLQFCFISLREQPATQSLFTTVRDRLVAFLRKCSYAAKNCLWHKRKRALSKGALFR